MPLPDSRAVRENWRTLAGKLSLSVGSVVLTLAFMELLVRLLDPVGRAALGMRFGMQPRSNYEADAALGYRPRDKYYFWDDGTNAPPVRAVDQTVRVFAFGDSFTKAHGSVGVSNSFYRTLQRGLRMATHERQYEFFHFGVSGYCERQYLALLRQMGPVYRPDIVIVEVFLGNDVHENGGLVVRRLALDDKGQLGIQDVGGGDALGLMERLHPKRWSFLYRLVQPRLCSVLGRARIMTPPLPHTVLDLARKASTPEIEAAWAETDRLLADFKAEAEKLNVRTLFVLVPQEMQVNQSLWMDQVRVFSLNPTEYDLDLPQRRCLGLLARHQMPSLDLAPPFRKAMEAGEVLYDGHFSRAGHALAAKCIMDALIAEGVISQ